MALPYHLVKRRDLRKGAAADAQLFYGQVRAGEPVTHEELCEEIADVSTASDGDVDCVVRGMVRVLKKNLVKGNTVRINGLGTFRIVAGSCGVEKEEDFHTSCFKKGRIIFCPATDLKDLGNKIQFKKLDTVEVEVECEELHA